MNKKILVAGLIIMGMVSTSYANLLTPKQEPLIHKQHDVVYHVTVLQSPVIDNHLPLVSGTGVYRSDSILVDPVNDIKSGKQKLLYSSSGHSDENGNFIFSSQRPHQGGVVKTVSVKNKQDPKHGMITETSVTMDYTLLDESLSLVVKPKGYNIFDVSLSQEYLNTMSKYDGLDLPNMSKWDYQGRFLVSKDKTLRIDTPVYQVDNKSYRNTYLIRGIDSIK